jgi:hypothetical protein
MDTSKIPPKSEWSTLSVAQLLDVKASLTETYYRMRGVNASFAPAYLQFATELDALIQRKEREAVAERAAEEAQG